MMKVLVVWVLNIEWLIDVSKYDVNGLTNLKELTSNELINTMRPIEIAKENTYFRNQQIICSQKIYMKRCNLAVIVQLYFFTQNFNFWRELLDINYLFIWNSYFMLRFAKQKIKYEVNIIKIRAYIYHINSKQHSAVPFQFTYYKYKKYTALRRARSNISWLAQVLTSRDKVQCNSMKIKTIISYS